MHSFTCILSQTRTKREDPPSSARRDSHHRSPTDGIPRLRRPDPPSGRFPFSPLAPIRRLGCRPWPPPATCPGSIDSPIVAPSGAAFFDLDRTLLRGASGEVFSEAMRSAGLVSRTIPGERYIYRLFNTVGETLPSMALARQAVDFAKGRSRASVQEAAEQRRRPVGGDGAAVRPTACSSSTAPRGGRWCSPPRLRTTSSSRSPTGSDSTT